MVGLQESILWGVRIEIVLISERPVRQRLRVRAVVGGRRTHRADLGYGFYTSRKTLAHQLEVFLRRGVAFLAEQGHLPSPFYDRSLTDPSVLQTFGLTESRKSCDWVH